jgi:hypothetical protein
VERDRLRMRRRQHARQRARDAHAPGPPLRTAFLGALALTPSSTYSGAAAPVPLLIAAVALAGTQAAVFHVLHNATLQTHVPEHLVSRIASVNMLGSLVAVPLGLGLAGPLAQATSPRTVLTAAAPDGAPVPTTGPAAQIESR